MRVFETWSKPASNSSASQRIKHGCGERHASEILQEMCCAFITLARIDVFRLGGLVEVLSNKALQTDTSRCHAPCIRKGRATLPCR